MTRIDMLCSQAASTLKVEAPLIYEAMVTNFASMSATMTDADMAFNAMRIEDAWLRNAINREELKAARTPPTEPT